jgi:hypothetical protein
MQHERGTGHMAGAPFLLPVPARYVVAKRLATGMRRPRRAPPPSNVVVAREHDGTVALISLGDSAPGVDDPYCRDAGFEPLPHVLQQRTGAVGGRADLNGDNGHAYRVRLARTPDAGVAREHTPGAFDAARNDAVRAG